MTLKKNPPTSFCKKFKKTKRYQRRRNITKKLFQCRLSKNLSHLYHSYPVRAT
ncbi:Uncharacterized protein dnm_031390 [Desulfonema magnum]|uniref:Uncharacterized protein n=1 Tax=Desulfonema magnum TaxID=45655 RepID=A0A975BKK5_9BACT|nr:Uncharacterized protein dnm_031390 [Desulfonema magnum]